MWEVRDKRLEEVPRDKIGLEKFLEDWLEQDISIISDDLLVVGRQVETGFGGLIDLLCLNRDGDVVIVELKKDKAPREVITQVLEYASWVDDLSYEDISNIANEYLKERSFDLESAFSEKFGVQLPDVLNESHEMLIVATDLDDQSERVIKYLSQYGIRINAVTFNYFKKDGREFIARVLLIPKSAEKMRETKRKGYLSEEELGRIAEANGVGDLFSTIVGGLASLFDSKGTTLSSVAFYGIQEGSMKTIFSIIPKESNQQDGLKFQVYLKRFARYFAITESDAENMLPANKKEWRYTRNAPPEYSGYEGFFKNKEEVESFLSKLRELKNLITSK